jgi:photosystem II stability/assembly factor-like uncharacterized protein
MLDVIAVPSGMISTSQREVSGNLTPDVVHTCVASPAFATDRVVLSGRDSGLWRSDDGADSFRQVLGPSSPGQLVTATCIAFAPDFPRDQTVIAGIAGAVARSSDGGRRWRLVALPAPPPLVTCLAFSPAYEEDGVILAGTLEDGVLRSDDRGDHWRRWNFGLLDLSVYCLAPVPDFGTNETIFAGTETALFKSENGGRSWRETSFPEPAPPILALAINQRGEIWAGTERHGVWQSADNGETWRRSGADVITSPVNHLVLGERRALAVLPDAIAVADGHGRDWRIAFADLGDDGGVAGVAVPGEIDAATTLLVQLRTGLMRELRIGHVN